MDMLLRFGARSAEKESKTDAQSSTSTPSALHPDQVQVCDLDAYITGTTNIKKDTAKM